MALLSLLLGATGSDGVEPPEPSERAVETAPRCPNPDCANRNESYPAPQMLVVDDRHRRCLYCEMELTL